MMKLSQVSQIIKGQLFGEDVLFDGVSTDTRTLKKGQLYWALRGEKFDGHDFITQAKQAGAVAAVISQDTETLIPVVKVLNTRLALIELARYYRAQFTIPLIAVTGSCGKTTTKALLTSVFNQCGLVLSNPKSFNNDIGVPLTLLQFQPTHQYAVTELGANHPGEIAFLTHLVRPDVAIITNAAEAHLEGFGDVDGVACAKGEIFQGLNSQGIAIINADDNHAGFWKQLAGSHRVITFGVKNGADVTAKNIYFSAKGQPHFDCVIGEETFPVQLNLLGEHNIYNALAAAAAGYALSLPFTAIQAGLNQAGAEKQRLNEYRTKENALIIDDSYNANPLSMLAAIKLLAQRDGKRILVIGDMRELGENAMHYHQQVGMQAKNLGIEELYCFGDLTRHSAQAFGKQAYFFKDRDELIQVLKKQLEENVTILVKGSRSMQMNQVVLALSDIS